MIYIPKPLPLKITVRTKTYSDGTIKFWEDVNGNVLKLEYANGKMEYAEYDNHHNLLLLKTPTSITKYTYDETGEEITAETTIL